MLVPSGNLSDEVDEVRNIVVMPDIYLEVWLSLFQDSKLLVVRYLLSIACLCRELLRCLGPWPKGRKHSSSKQCWIASYACALQPANLDTPVSDSFITLKCTMTKACEPCKQHQRVKAHKAHQRSGPPH